MPDVGTGTGYKFAILGADGAVAREGRPDGRSTPRSRPPPRRWSSSRRTPGATTRGWTQRARSQPLARADVDLRDAPRLVAQAPRRRRATPTPSSPTTWSPYLTGPRLHPRRVPAGDGAPVRRLVGLPGDVVLRAHRAVRRPRRLPPPGRPAAPGRHRRDRRLGARALPQGRVRAGPLRRHAALRGPEPVAAASTPTGARTSSTSAAARSATSWSRTRSTGWRSSTSTGSASTPSPRCSTSTTPASPASGRPTSTAAARTSRPCSSCRR